MKPIASKSAEESASDSGMRDYNSTLSRKDDGSQLSFADTALAAEPSIGNSARGETGLMQSTTHEIQIVVYVGGNAGGSQGGFK